jgi:hypothetical protein
MLGSNPCVAARADDCVIERRLFRRLQEGLARRRDLGALRDVAEQRHADLRLQVLDLLAERLLSYPALTAARVM